MARQLLPLALLLTLITAGSTFAQPTGDSLIRGLDPDADANTVEINRRNRSEIQTVRTLTGDGQLSTRDLERVFDSAGDRIHPDEMEIIRLALQGKVPGGPDFQVTTRARERAVDLLYEANLFDESVQDLADGKTYAGTEVPLTVKEVVARAKLNGAKAYDVEETNSDGELIYTHYPPLRSATGNMAFGYTEVTPDSILADKQSTADGLNIARTERHTYIHPPADNPNVREAHTPFTAGQVQAGTYRGLKIDDTRSDVYKVVLEAGETLKATIRFDRLRGSLSLALTDHLGNEITRSSGNGDAEQVQRTIRDGDDVPDETLFLFVSGENGAENDYELDIETSHVINVGRYEPFTGGTGRIGFSYDDAFHPIRPMQPHVLMRLGYSPTLSTLAVNYARRGGNKWSANCAILSDGSVHCLPAIRRNPQSRFILTNPALARGQQLLWNGHINVNDAGEITLVRTSGGIAKRVSRGKDIIINPKSILEAWGFTVNVNVTDDHREHSPLPDADRCILVPEPGSPALTD